jgi:hypothetical protein
MLTIIEFLLLCSYCILLLLFTGGALFYETGTAFFFGDLVNIEIFSINFCTLVLTLVYFFIEG